MKNSNSPFGSPSNPGSWFIVNSSLFSCKSGLVKRIKTA